MNLIKTLTFIFILLNITPVSAKLIQILHTNDLHSYFKGTRAGLGGYARLKTVVDSLREQASAKGIPTLYLDAGDWSEGTSFYFSNEGTDSLRALDLLGVDVTTLGNHDYLLGAPELSRQILNSNLRAKIVSANLRGKSKIGLDGIIYDYVDFNIDGNKVRVFGLSTDSLTFQYPLRPYSSISSSHKAGIKMSEKAQRDGIDFLISLTHTGLSKDQALVEKTRSIDLVVSGHNMVRLDQPKMIKNLSKRMIPIVQAGGHSIAVGSLIMDISKDEKKVIEYKLHNIDESVPENKQMKDLVTSAANNRNIYFGRNWDEVIGYTEIPLTGNVNALHVEYGTCWSKHIARLTRIGGEADLGFQFDNFQGEWIDPGPITFGEMIDNFPHFRNWNDQGWKLARVKVSGFVLKQVLKYLKKSHDGKAAITIDGLQVMKDDTNSLVSFDFKKHNPKQALIDGHPLRNLRFYTIALPSEIPYAVEMMSATIGHWIFRDLHYLEDKSFWPLLESYIRDNSPIRCLED